jgi:hypothetical protein
MNGFTISQATTVYWETDNDGSAVYVIAKHPNGWSTRIDAPTELDGNWLTMAQRRRWAKDKVRKAIELIELKGGEA